MLIRLAFAGLFTLAACYGQAPRPKPETVVMPLTWAEMDVAQRKLVEQALAEPVASVNGPYNALLRSPEMGLLAHNWGGYVRFRSSVPTKLNELAIMMAAQFWKSEFVWSAHRRAAVQAGLKEEIAVAIAQGKRPTGMQPDEEAVYNFSNELLTTRMLNDSTFASVKKVVGDKGVMDLTAAIGYFAFASMAANVDQFPLPDNVKPELVKNDLK